MISIQNGILELHTKNTSYILGFQQGGQLENLHYGSRIKVENPLPLYTKADAGYGMDVLRKKEKPALSSLNLELSAHNRGDYRRGALTAVMGSGASTSDFVVGAVVERDAPAPSGGMPQAHLSDEVVQVVLSDASGLEAELFYTVFYDTDVISKKMRVTNRSDKPIKLTRALSQQLDLPVADYILCTLNGAWAREFHLNKSGIRPGITLMGSNTGASGSRCNPFFMVAQPDANEHSGEVYGFNLVYSGSHEASVERDPHGRTRVMQGIWSDGFAWDLAPGESFVTPEAILSFSESGYNGLSLNMHRFVKKHILPPYWADRARPVLVNNWEGTYFSFNERKLVGIARKAASLGIELFVLDDGWFGRRNSDLAGLGDYDVNLKKLPGGLGGLAKKINKMGMRFGLWFEPEMVNEDSALFEKHPDWIVKTPGYQPAKGRNQYVLDLCREEVRDYIISSMGSVLDSASIDYVKWDMNRNISDNFSPSIKEQGEFMHRYTLGLYEIMEHVCATRPKILFEGCSSGGNRFDLGILSYMPQMWTSDDTDAHERQKIQTGISYGYPQCTLGCHVSAVPNHQTLRRTPHDTRFNTSVFGVLGYEQDLRTISFAESKDISHQVAWYKKHRQVLQFGDFYRLKSPFDSDRCSWIVVSADKTSAVAGDFMGLLVPNALKPPLRLTGLEDKFLYNIVVRRQKMPLSAFGGLVNFVSPVHVNPDGLIMKAANKVYRLDTETESYTAYGSLLCKAGVKLLQDFSGAGYAENMRLVSDFASRLYVINKIET